jgi:hypothetical protein
LLFDFGTRRRSWFGGKASFLLAIFLVLLIALVLCGCIHQWGGKCVKLPDAELVFLLAIAALQSFLQ